MKKVLLLLAMTVFSAQSFANDSHFAILKVVKFTTMTSNQRMMAKNAFGDCRILFRHIAPRQIIDGEMILDNCSAKSRVSGQRIYFKNFGSNAFRDRYYQASINGNEYTLLEQADGTLQLFDDNSGTDSRTQTGLILATSKDARGNTEVVRAEH